MRSAVWGLFFLLSTLAHAQISSNATIEQLNDAKATIQGRLDQLKLYQELRYGKPADDDVSKQHGAVAFYSALNDKLAKTIEITFSRSYSVRKDELSICKSHFETDLRIHNQIAQSLSRFIDDQSHRTLYRARIYTLQFYASMFAAKALDRSQDVKKSNELYTTGLILPEANPCFLSAERLEINQMIEARQAALSAATISVMGELGMQDLSSFMRDLAQAQLDQAKFDRDLFFISTPVIIAASVYLAPYLATQAAAGLAWAKAARVAYYAVNVGLGAVAVHPLAKSLAKKVISQDLDDIQTWQKTIDEAKEVLSSKLNSPDLYYQALSPYVFGSASNPNQAGFVWQMRDELFTIQDGFKTSKWFQKLNGNMSTAEQYNREQLAAIDSEIARRALQP